MQQLICDNLNGMRSTQTILATALHRLDRDTSPLKRMVARSWNIGTGEQSQGETLGDGPRDMRKEIVVEDAFAGKRRRHAGKAIMLSHAQGVEPSPYLLSPHMPALAADQERKTDEPSKRKEPQPGQWGAGVRGGRGVRGH